MNVLQAIQAHCARSLLPVPGSAASSNNKEVVQMFALMNELVEDLFTRPRYQQITREAVFTSVGAEDQGSIYTIADGGFQYILPDTFYNRSNNFDILYGLTEEEWQIRKASAATGPSFACRIRGDRLMFSPALTNGQTLAFEYKTNYIVFGGFDPIPAYKRYFTRDDDTFALPDPVLTSWLRWRWKAQKGLDYAEEKAAYELILDTIGKQSNGPRTIDMGKTSDDRPRAGIVLPIGSWRLP